jgi:hypothetical protein
MSRRRRQIPWADSFQLPAMPFLAIMLGLVSVMALTAIVIARENREDMQSIQGVELVGVPARFIPFYIRCEAERVHWRDDDGDWREFDSRMGIIALLDDQLREAYQIAGVEDASAKAFREYVLAKAEANKRLSFSRRQNTLIMWVEPDAAEVASTMQTLIANLAPIRIGLLPIMPNEKIEHVQR